MKEKFVQELIQFIDTNKQDISDSDLSRTLANNQNNNELQQANEFAQSVISAYCLNSLNKLKSCSCAALVEEFSSEWTKFKTFV